MTRAITEMTRDEFEAIINGAEDGDAIADGYRLRHSCEEGGYYYIACDIASTGELAPDSDTLNYWADDNGMIGKARV